MSFNALILDVGGVLILRPGREALAAWEAGHGRPDGFLDDAFLEALGPGWEGGRSEAEILRRLRDICEVSEPDLPDLLETLAADERLCPEMEALVCAVEGRYRLALPTNAGPDARTDLTGRWKLDRWFEVIVVSAEEGISKPHPDIYVRTCERIGMPPSQCLFVDDREANVRGAIEAGLSTCHYISAAETLPRLRSMLNL